MRSDVVKIWGLNALSQETVSGLGQFQQRASYWTWLERARPDSAALSLRVRTRGAEAARLVTVGKVSEADRAVCVHQVELSLCFWIAGEAFAAKS